MEYAAGDLCPVCESGKLEENVKNLDFEYKERKSIVENITCFDCPVCGESYTNRKESRAIEKFLTDERRREDGLLVSNEIKSIRKKLAVTQVQFARAFRVGEKNFARYENGQTTQGAAMDCLLRVLREHPEAFKLFHDNWSDVGEQKVYQFKFYYKRKKAIEKRSKTNVDYNLSKCVL